MINIFAENGILRVKGTFNFGYIGNYTNEDCHAEQIKLLGNLSVQNGNGYEIRGWSILQERLNASSATANEIAHCLTDYYNAFEQKIQKNIKQINDNFLIYIYDQIVDTNMEFWDMGEITNRNFLPKIQDNEELTEAVYGPYREIVSSMLSEYLDKPNDGSIEKCDVEKAVRRMFPMFDLDSFLKGVQPESLGLNDGRVSFQCSDSLSDQILCSAYDVLDESLTFTDWHNF